MAAAVSTAQAGCVATGLVFSIDASGSIDDTEYALQVTGIVQALRDPDILDSIEASGGVMVAAVVWSSKGLGVDIVPWQVISGRADAEAFGASLSSLPRRGDGDTDLGFGLSSTLDLFGQADRCMRRRVIDLSGDGRETIEPRRRPAFPLYKTVRRAALMGVTVNGLAIADGTEPGIDAYFRKYLATGRSSFVMSVDSFDRFAVAMRLKVLREISGSEVSLRDDPDQVVFPR